jgi:hypothetical protein
MHPNSRLLIRFTFPNGDQKGWGYDYPHYETSQKLLGAIQNDFEEGLPDHTEIHLFYYNQDEVIEATDALDLAVKATAWLVSTGEYYGN